MINFVHRIDILKESNSIEGGIGMPDLTLSACLVGAWTVIGLVLMKGIKSSGKVAYFLAVFPYIVLCVLLVRSATLEGAVDGMLYFIIPEWDKMFEAKLWYAAVTQVFYALGVCFGSIIMYSSYNRFNQNVTRLVSRENFQYLTIPFWFPRDCHIITTMDYLTSLLAGLIIFGILGHCAHVMKVDIRQVTNSYMGLAFIAYPETIAKFDFMPQFFSLVFFFMLFLFCIGSNMGMANCIMTVIRDRYPDVKCWKIVIGIVTFGVSIGLIYTSPGGQFIINLLDFYGASFVALVLAIVELVAVSWIYGVNRFCRDIDFMLNQKTGIYWRICWKYITPSIMLGILAYFISTWEPITYQGRQYSSELHMVGWAVSLLGLLQIPIWAVYAFIKQREGSFFSRIKKSFKPAHNWGPGDIDTSKHFGLIYENVALT